MSSQEAPRPGGDADHPASVRWVNEAIAGYIRRMGRIWVEGQIAQVSVRQDRAYLRLRDLNDTHSMPVYLNVGLLRKQQLELEQGQRVLIQAQVDYWVRRGELQMRADSIRAVGIGDLLAQLERLKQLLQSEGLFAPERKRVLPFLPQRVGLITGRNSDAEKDVITNARLRWPAVEFELREVPVQGTEAVTAVKAALAELDQLPEVDVIVIARGGGSVEDLLPFSNESLVRAVAAARTPVVSAIGHEKDAPILDLVADLRASTPTDAGKRIVPDLAEQSRLVRDLSTRARRALADRMAQEERHLDQLRNRPVLAQPAVMVDRQAQLLSDLRDRADRSLLASLGQAATAVDHTVARVRALSPHKTLARGYAVVQRADGHVVRHPDEATGSLLVRVSEGQFHARKEDTDE